MRGKGDERERAEAVNGGKDESNVWVRGVGTEKGITVKRMTYLLYIILRGETDKEGGVWALYDACGCGQCNASNVNIVTKIHEK